MRDAILTAAAVATLAVAAVATYRATEPTAKPRPRPSPEISSTPQPQGLTGAPGAVRVTIPEGTFTCRVLLRESGITDGSLLFDGAVPDPVDAYAWQGSGMSVVLCRPAIGPSAGDLVVRVWVDGALATEHYEYDLAWLDGEFEPVGPFEHY